MSLTDQISDMISPTIEQSNLRLWDINLTRAGKKSIVSIAIDKDGGLPIDDISEFSKQIAPILDTIDSLGDAYHLEVTSPGLERTLKLPEHFRWSLGYSITVSCRVDGTIKRYSGKLENSDDEKISLNTETGLITIPIEAITKAHTLFDFDEAMKRGKEIEELEDSETDDEQLQGEIA